MSSDRRRDYRLVMAVLVAALVAAVLTAGVIGAAGLSVAEALRALGGLIRHGTDAVGDFPDWAPRLLFDLRLPRILLALITGAALSTAGASFQGVFRNPLAEPYLLGVSAGAGLGATIAIVGKPLTALGIYAVPLLAFVGATAGRLPGLPRSPPSAAAPASPPCCYPGWPSAPPSRRSCRSSWWPPRATCTPWSSG